MTPGSSSEPLSLLKQRITFPKSSLLIFIPLILTPLIFLHLQSLSPPLPLPPPKLPSNHTLLLSMLRHSITFLPLKNPLYSHTTWFMSSLPDSPKPEGEPAHILFPSAATNNRLLCLSATNPNDGARNVYALAFPEALPENSTLLPGLTFVADTFYDYTNPWHGLSAILPFVRWHAVNGRVPPARWVLFHWGEVRRGMGSWVRALAEASTGGEVRVEAGEGLTVDCYEKAVVMRRNDEGIGAKTKEGVYDFMRGRARAYCGLERRGQEGRGMIRMTLLFRTGSRSFKNETAVAGVFERECRKVADCRVRLARTSNLTFCDQVKLMSETDILVSPHGAQMTNMIFMDKNSSIMEFFPTGWLELAGAGQYVFRWLADWAGMRHRGQWRDPEGESCPFENKEECFTFYKDQRIGHDEAFFSQWAADVLQEAKIQKSQNAFK